MNSSALQLQLTAQQSEVRRSKPQQQTADQQLTGESASRIKRPRRD
jgi:hypothetical protein